MLSVSTVRHGIERVPPRCVRLDPTRTGPDGPHARAAPECDMLSTWTVESGRCRPHPGAMDVLQIIELGVLIAWFLGQVMCADRRSELLRV